MKRLTAYCRKTIMKAAQEYTPNGKASRGEARKQAIKSAYRDAMRGTDSGWWNDLIYTAPMLKMSSYYRADIGAAVRDYLSETGEAMGNHCDRDKEFTWADVLASTRKGWKWEDYRGDNGRDNETNAMAQLWGLRFAVKYITGNLASDWEV